MVPAIFDRVVLPFCDKNSPYTNIPSPIKEKVCWFIRIRGSEST